MKFSQSSGSESDLSNGDDPVDLDQEHTDETPAEC